MKRISHHTAEQSQELFEFINQLGFEKEHALRLLELGAIYLNRQRLKQPTEVKKNDYIRIHHDPRRYTFANTEPLILDRQKEFLIALKPAGLPTHETLDNAVENLKVQLEKKLNENLISPQRLDVPTSGLILFARDKKFARHFSKMLENGDVKKQYHAICHSLKMPTPGRLCHFMRPDPRSPKTLSLDELPNWKKCLLDIQTVEKWNELAKLQLTRLKIQLLTGRTHQIRAQLAFEGSPILGDHLYGEPYDINGIKKPDLVKAQSASPIALTCTGLEFSQHSYDLKKIGDVLAGTQVDLYGRLKEILLQSAQPRF